MTLREADHSWFIKFYTPQCKHCKVLKPLWDLAADKLTNERMTVAQVDCSLHANHLICLQFHVRAYPTIMLLRDDQYFKFRGKRSMQAFYEFVDEEGYLLSDDHGPLPELLPGQLVKKHKEKQQ